jgi:hypothetical protein
MGCALYIRCALSIHQNECRKSLGCALYIGARYLKKYGNYFEIRIFFNLGPALAKFVETLRYKPIGRRLDFPWSKWLNPSEHTVNQG